MVPARLRRSPVALLVLGIACGSADAPGEPSLAAWACAHTDEGRLVDAAADRGDAPTLSIGSVAHRVNVRPGEPGYLAFTLREDADLQLLTDDPEGVAAIWTEERVAIEAVPLEPGCDAVDLFTADLALVAGEHAIEVGPTLQANIWLAVGVR